MFAGLPINAGLLAAWFLEGSHPDRIGYWYLIFFVVLPVLGIIALVALVLSRTKALRWYGGALVLAYVALMRLLSL